jgi:hypothetical protein
MSYTEWESEWLLLNANSAIFQLYHGEDKLIFNVMTMKSALYSTNTLSWIFIVLSHWNNNLWIDMWSLSDTLSWFRAIQSLFFLFIIACLAEKQQYQFYSFWFDPIGDWTHDLLEASTLTITSPSYFRNIYNIFTFYIERTLPLNLCYMYYQREYQLTNCTHALQQSKHITCTCITIYKIITTLI